MGVGNCSLINWHFPSPKQKVGRKKRKNQSVPRLELTSTYLFLAPSFTWRSIPQQSRTLYCPCMLILLPPEPQTWVLPRSLKKVGKLLLLGCVLQQLSRYSQPCGSMTNYRASPEQLRACWKLACPSRANEPQWSRVKLRDHRVLPRSVHHPRRWSQKRDHHGLG